jgi:protein PhnA
MSFERELQKRSNGICELCGSDEANIDYTIPFSPGNKLEHHIWVCSTCQNQMSNTETADGIHWRCLNDSIWSETPAVQVVSWRMLHKLKQQVDWVPDLLDIVYLDDETMEWAKASGDDINQDDIEKSISMGYSVGMAHRCTRVKNPGERKPEVFAKIPRGVKAFRKNCRVGVPLFRAILHFH